LSKRERNVLWRNVSADESVIVLDGFNVVEEAEESTSGNLSIGEFEKVDGLAGLSVEIDGFDVSVAVSNGESSDNWDISVLVEESLLNFVDSDDAVGASALSWEEVGSSAPGWSLLIRVEVPVAISRDEGLVCWAGLEERLDVELIEVSVLLWRSDWVLSLLDVEVAEDVEVLGCILTCKEGEVSEFGRVGGNGWEEV